MLTRRARSEDLRISRQERIQRVADHLFLVLEHRRFVDIFANAVVEDSTVEHPGHLDFGRRWLALRGKSQVMAAFPDDAREYLVAHDTDIPPVDVESLQTRIEIDAQPLSPEDHLGVAAVELEQPIP